MHFPFIPFTLISAEQGADGLTYEIFLNRIGINTIELPREAVSVVIGGKLRLNLVNRGAPVHVTVSSSNAGAFTDFFHENMYVVDSIILTIPIRETAREGFFDIELLTGYGVNKTALHIDVIEPVPVKKPGPETVPIQPVAHGRPHLLMITMGLGLILYSAWLYLGIEFLNIAAFITLIVGALFTWYRQQQPLR